MSWHNECIGLGDSSTCPLGMNNRSEIVVPGRLLMIVSMASYASNTTARMGLHHLFSCAEERTFALVGRTS